MKQEKEQLASLIIILVLLLIIPLKIISFGWFPPDDAMRHVAFSTLDCKWSDILVIDSKFDTDHNAGWHQILRFLHKKCNISKIGLLRFSIIALFLLINICGIISSPSAICWLLSVFFLLISDFGLLWRFMLGRPYIVSCAVTLIVLRLWALPNSNDEFSNSKRKVIRILLSTILFSLGTWIHGSWYIFLLIPFSFLLAGKVKDSILLTASVILGTVIGAALTGNFVDFLAYHFNATLSIYGEKTYNWLLVSENASGIQNTYVILFVFFIIALCIYKKKLSLKELTTDPAFLLMLLSWLLSIMVIRFWIDWGRMALLFWLSYRFKDLIASTQALREPRVRFCLFLFVVTAVFFITTNDGGGRYSKAVFDQPIDFNEERLAGWAPEPGGIVYNDGMGVFYKHFFEYPTAPWKYILGFESAIMKNEDKKVLRKIGYNFRLPEEYLPWINKMTNADRIITSAPIGDFPQLESIRGARNYWIYKLKTASDTQTITHPNQ